MSLDLNSAIVEIKKAGVRGVRALPMPNQHVTTGKYVIEVLDNGVWRSIVEGVPKSIADSLIAQATNRVICG